MLAATTLRDVRSFLTNLWVLLFAPGVALHELGHYLVARVLGAEIEDVVWFQLENGLFGGNIVLGRVTHSAIPESHLELRKILISLAPIAISCTGAATALWAGLRIDGAADILFWYLATVFLARAFPSSGDIFLIENYIEDLPARLRPVARPIPALLEVLLVLRRAVTIAIAFSAWFVVQGLITNRASLLLLLAYVVGFPLLFYLVFVLWDIATGKNSLKAIQAKITNAEGQQSSEFINRIEAENESAGAIVDEAIELLQDGHTGSFLDIVDVLLEVADTEPAVIDARIPVLTTTLRDSNNAKIRHLLLTTIKKGIAEAENPTISQDAVDDVTMQLGVDDPDIQEAAVELLLTIGMEAAGPVDAAAPALLSGLGVDNEIDDAKLIIAAQDAAMARPHVFEPYLDTIAHHATTGDRLTQIAALSILGQTFAVSERERVERVREETEFDSVRQTADATLEQFDTARDAIEQFRDADDVDHQPVDAV